MNIFQDRPADLAKPFLRIYRGEEDGHDLPPDGPEDPTGTSMPDCWPNIKFEMFWAGRNLASRHSARVAA